MDWVNHLHGAIICNKSVSTYLHRDYTFLCAGLSAKYVSTDGNDMSSTSSKVSSFSVPPTPRSEGEILQSSNLKSFSLADLKMATRNFRPDSVLGEGGFGSVFKGWIDEHSFAATKPGTGMVIAVKRLNQESFQGHKEWLVSSFSTTLRDSARTHNQIGVLLVLLNVRTCETFFFSFFHILLH